MNKHKWEEKAEDSLVSILLCLKALTMFIAEIAVIILSNFTHDYNCLQLMLQPTANKMIGMRGLN